MILQTQSGTLAALLAEHGDQYRHARAMREAVSQARSKAENPPILDNICNDRTTLTHQTFD